MSFLDSFRQKASIFDRIAETFTPTLSRAEKFRLQYRLPKEEEILDDINVDLSFVGGFSKAKELKSNPEKKEQAVAYVFSGRLFLTQHYLVFRDGYDQESCVLILNLSTVKRVERTPGESQIFALTVLLYSGTEVIIQFMGLRHTSEQFSELLKKKLKQNIPNARNLSRFLESCYSEFILYKNIPNSNKKSVTVPPGGLGQRFKYPGKVSLEREKTKLRLWFNYFKEHGENLAMVRNHMFQKLIRVGLPNRLRGELWELCAGSMYLRHANPGEYQTLLNENQGKPSQAIDEIEKDLKRSLPEYPAYQTEEGISRLRNVLTAYSWRNPDVGYCQAMNIVVAGLLIYMTEEQAFWCLTNLCDIYVPGYYSKTMYGTLLDQKVFEAFVEEKMPVLWEHITQQDIQLSVVSLPWFLSLFFTSMPLEYAFRIMDIFFMNGPKTLFQVALAVLKINGEDLMEAEEDGMFIAILKSFFQTLGESAHPDSPDIKYKQITKFQELLVTAFKEFSVITESIITQERNKHENGILQNIETFVKRTQLRQLPKMFNLTDTDLSNIYDLFYQSIETHKISMGTGSSNMTFDVFVQFLSKFCDWCRPLESDQNPAFQKQKTSFLKKLFDDWDVMAAGELTLNDVVTGLEKLMTRDLLELINYFFSLFDGDRDGELHREEVLQASESLLFLTEAWKTGKYVDELTKKSIENDIADNIVKENGGLIQTLDEIQLPTGVTLDEEKYKSEQAERYLRAASNFLQRCFEYARPLELAEEINLIDLSDDEEEGSKYRKRKVMESMVANAALDPTHPKVIDIATFRMIILADETYELFFSRTLRHSIHIHEKVAMDNNQNKALRSMFDGIIADGRRVAEQVRRRVDSVATRSSIPSVDSTSNQTRVSSGTKEEKDLDDFTSDHRSEHDELLSNAWIEMGETAEIPHRMDDDKKVRTILSDDIAQNHDLIEFEA